MMPLDPGYDETIQYEENRQTRAEKKDRAR